MVEKKKGSPSGYAVPTSIVRTDLAKAGTRAVSTESCLPFAENSTLAFLRRGRAGTAPVLCLFNFTPVPRPNHRVGVPSEGRWVELLNTDAAMYGGSGHGNLGGVETTPVGAHGRPVSLNLTLPPLGAVLLRPA